MVIPFSPPDITEAEIDAVAHTLRSGWITTGPKTKEFEKRIASFCGVNKASCFNSATASLECALHLLGIGPGDEVVVPAYTYTATVSPVCHVGATPVMVDVAHDSYDYNLSEVVAAITSHTKAIIAVDLGGMIADYASLYSIAKANNNLFHPESSLQEALGRIAILADGAHSFGAMQAGTRSGSIADFTSFSFHAVKNLTTAEGGALAWRSIPGIDDNAIYHSCQLLSLHGQNKDALTKNMAGAWEYDIVEPYYKWNMTDIMASIGLVQLDRYPEMLQVRHNAYDRYVNELLDGAASINSAEAAVSICNHYHGENISSGHLMLTRLNGFSAEERNAFIASMAELGVACNIHYKPLPMMTAYRKLGFDIANYPAAYSLYANEVTLPLYSTLTNPMQDYVIASFSKAYNEFR